MRAHNPDGSDLIALCRNCHTYIHAHNTPVMRESLMAIVAYRLITLE
nr:MAG TPA: HNH endonuclease [Caudoviricetes sp.]